MPNLLQSLARASWNRSARLAAGVALLLAFAPAARADEILFRGQKIEYAGAAEVKTWGEIGSGMEEMVFIYTNADPNVIKYFKPSRDVDVRILAVGGGGGGGTIKNQTTFGQYGAGGGGGAGELVARDGVRINANAKYVMSVGAGGAGATAVTSAKSGTAGGATAMTNETTGAEIFLLNGGGGGGGQATGKAGGSGGGGSFSSSAKAGGTSEKHEADGMGNAGGQGTNKYYGGGGGGATSAGDPGVTGKPGAGGAGYASDIAIAKDTPKENWLWYAGGGGGGVNISDVPSAAGGSGVGGNGGTYANNDDAAPTRGKDGTGSGGGGGQRYRAGASGGCGVVIIRVTYIEIPIVWQEIPVTVGGNTGTIFIDERANYKWVNGGQDLVLMFTNVNFRGAMKIGTEDVPIWANGRILAVGGGGGGGLVNVRDNGAGAGGGAGGFVEKSGFVFDNTKDFSISIGRGGKASPGNKKPGEKGDESFVLWGDDRLAEAAGGGAGGAEGAGGDGASGGGGSYGNGSIPDWGWQRPGGSGIDGQGFPGGKGGIVYRGGGGGGAGGPGGDATGPTSPGIGGQGKPCNITGEEKWYAAGGGGAYLNTEDPRWEKLKGGRGGGNADGTIIIGGSGAGVDGGATGYELHPIPATDGKDGTGSGGGGGVSYEGAVKPDGKPETAGKGGDGVVIIRLSNFVVDTVPYPKVVPGAPFTYDGNAHTGVVKFFAYELRGVPVATNANTYEVWAWLKEGSPYTWPDGTQGDSPHETWTINKLPVEVPGATSNFVYNATVHCPIDKNTPKWTIEDGCAWTTNNTAGKKLRYCQLVDDGEGTKIGYERIHAGEYTVKAVLWTDNGTTANFRWSDGSTGDKTYPWKVKQAPNAISNFYYTGYRWPDRIGAHHPRDQFDVAWGRETTKTAYRVDRGDGTYGEWTNWGTDGPASNGNYEVRVAIDTTPDWQGSTNVLAFGTWEKWSDIYTDRMEITVSGNTSGSTTLTNFPVAVRIHEPERDGYAVFSGFDYTRAGATGKEIHFFDQDGDPVEHDVDNWNTRDASLVWVRVPKLKNTNTKLTMCWRRVNGIRLPDYDGAAVWRDNYAGVWHMTKQEGGHIVDASGNDQNLFLSPAYRASLAFDSNGKMGREATVRDGELRASNVFTNAADAAVLYTYDRTGAQATKSVGRTDQQITVATDGATVDEARLMKAAPSDKWKSMEATAAKSDVCAYGLVIREEKLCDWWLEKPAANWKTIWRDDETISTPSVGKYQPTSAGGGNTAVTISYQTLPGGEPLPGLPSNQVGYYRATFDHANPSGTVDSVMYEYRPQPHAVDFYVIQAPNPTTDLGGIGGDSGRILLMNADTNPGYAVENQGWCARTQRGTVTDGVTCWWMTAGEVGDGTNNVMGGTSFELVRCADTNVLWTLTECRQGNTFPTNGTGTAGLSTSQCYLPASSATALSITNESVAAERGSTGWVMMRNTPDACITSSCFTNGIGTIYFDAVNGRKAITSGTGRNDDGYHLVLEIERTEGVWEPVTMSVTTIRNTNTDKGETNELVLKETEGGKQNYFYRVHANIVKPYGYGPVRFRIRRTTEDVTAAGLDDGFILIDNIIVSVPPVSVRLSPYNEEHFDPKLAGDAAVGFGGAFAVPFPSVAGGAFPGRCRVTLPPGTKYAGQAPSEYVSMAQMFYRWRYLGQADDWRVAVLEDDGTDGMATAGDLEAEARPGDLEFYFVSMMKTDYYKYLDYTGLNKPVSKAGYSEEITKNPCALNLSEHGVSRLASGGTNWFVRVRDGRSDWERMTLELRGAISNDCPMRLVADGTWRALLPIPTNAGGRCTFRFRGRNRQTAGAKDYADNTTVFGGGAEEVELPRNGVLTVGGAATPFTVDHVTGYLEFQLGADGSDSPTWSASRAEYQNFNDWHDVWSSSVSRQFATGTNGVDSMAMTTKNLDMAGWRLYGFEDSAWSERFQLANSDDPGYPKETFFQSHKTPSAWSGYNLTFVSKNLVKWEDSSKGSTAGGSGMAAKLQGQGGGILEYNKANNPKGLEKIAFTARIGQSLGFDDISYASDNAKTKDYTFVCPVSMSRSVSDNTMAGDMSVGGAVSVFAYYRERQGCYEFRVTRTAAGAAADKPEVLLELFKWHPVNGAMKQDRLCGQRFNFEGADSLRCWNNSGEVSPKYFALFISAKSSSGGTAVYCGLGKDERAVTGDTEYFSGTAGAPNGYGGLYYFDTANDRLTSGSYGVAAKDCPAQFVRPRHYEWPVATAEKGSSTPAGLTDTGTYEGGKYFKPSANKNFCFAFDEQRATATKFDYGDIADGFWELGPQIEKWTAHAGLRTPLGLTQDVVVQLQDKSGGDWFDWKRIPVTGYSLSEKTVPVHLTGDYNLRLTTGSNAVDVVVGEVSQRQWRGLDHENLTYGANDFVYTQGVVASNDLRRAKETLLQPARGVATRPLSVRSPVLGGLGKVSFSYEDADPNAEIWVQVATNSVEYNLTSEKGYNLSVTSVERGEPEPVGAWITVAKYGASADCPDGPLGKSGVRTVYLGWHDQAKAPVKGLFRVFIPPAVVEKAIVLATNATQNVDYGRISVTGMTVTDEPGVSERSWRGWNLRTIGDEDDLEGRMFLDDGLVAGEIGRGLSCALNNSVNDIRDDDAETASFNNPTIWSPMLEPEPGKSRSVGSVTFRARLYHPGDARETETGGVVTLYGATSSTSDKWTKLVDIRVTGSAYSNYTWTALGETRFRAVKLEVSGSAAKTRNPDRDRVIVDEIALTEKQDVKIGFEYVRPFRLHLFEPVVIEDIESPNEQPLVGESWGVQTKLRLEQLGREASGLEVYLAWHEGERPWGYGMWQKPGERRVRLVSVGDPKDGIFRSVGTTADALVPPQSSAGVVQYMVILQYAGEGEETSVSQYVEKEDWAQPSWYWPVDYNEKNGGYADPDKFSPYTVLDSVSPGRAWINEVNWNDGAKPQGSGALTTTNQFIEICVPQAVDMDGWSVRVTDLNMNQRTLVNFGLNVPAKKKPTTRASEHFEFVVVESPATEAAGGICDWEGKRVEADGVWAAANLDGTITAGTLEFNRPFQFELVRPSGVIEHQIVVGGTNTMAKKSYGYLYEATNMLANLNEAMPSAKRFLAGYDLDRAEDVRYFGSEGVVGGTAAGTPAPGGEGTWKDGLKFTPGRLNDGQVIPSGWYLPPTGTNSWVTLRVLGSHLMQSVGGESGEVLALVMPQDVPTNVTYRATNWYEIATLTVDGVTNATHVARGGREWTYTLTPTGQLCEVVATEGYDGGLDKYGIRPGANYAQEVMNWLAKKWPYAEAGDIRLAAYKGLCANATAEALGLVDMYWLDIPPVPENEAEKNFAAAGGTNWWLRGDVVGWRPNSVTRTVHYGAGDVDYINTQVDIKLYVSNAVSAAAHAPAYLQGYGNKLSTESGNWDSETFQVIGKLFNGKELNKGYLPFRSFVFDSLSFSGPDAEKPFTTTVEIFDPFSTQSPGYSYGWGDYPRSTPFFFKWRLSTNAVPQAVEKLRVKSTYDRL